jgi:ABC-type dipeptide/oligopeptide/nickel transport system ATPase component
VINSNSILEISNLTIVNSIKRNSSFFSTIKTEARSLGLLVADMNFVISRRKIHGIVGESGSGKSLSMRAILGLIDINPGIITGSINFRGSNGLITEIVSQQEKSGASLIIPNAKPNSFRSKTELNITEYFPLDPPDTKYYLKHHRIVPDSVELFSMKNNYCLRKMRSSLHVHDNHAWVEFDPIAEMYNALIIVRYKIRIENPGNTLKKQTEEELVRNKLRGDKIAMIMQDPQTFLNPYWTIGAQLSNIIRLQQKRQEISDYAERNYSLVIVGDIEDYPVQLTWEKDRLIKFLRYADIHVNGEELDMFEFSSYELGASREVDFGKQTVGKKFKVAIHLLDLDSNITVSWDKNLLEKKIIEGTILYDSNKIHNTKNMLEDSSITLNDPIVNSDGEIHFELLLMTDKNIEFRSTLTISAKNYKNELTFGLEKGASDGLDAHKGEYPEMARVKMDYSGFLLDDRSSVEKTLSHSDIKSPVHMYCQFPNITITPKVEKRMDNFSGCIKITSNSGAKRLLHFGYSHEMNDNFPASTASQDSTESITGTGFEAGFILDNSEQMAAYSSTDIRSYDRTVDVETEVSSLLSKVDLDDSNNEFRKKLPSKVSGGQSQRVMISLAMASKPEVLIADEPTTGLDVSKQREIIQLFQQYKAQGRTIILISHDMNFINHLADNYTIIYAGYDVEHVSAVSLRKKHHLHPYTQRLFEIATAGEGKIFDAIDEDIPDPYNHSQQGCPFFDRCHRALEIGIKSKEHICNSVFPPLVNVDQGIMIYNNRIDNFTHTVRCWLYLSSSGDS